MAAHPTADAIAKLEQRIAQQDSPDLDREREMISGLEQLLEVVSQAALPVVTTQHRVIGDDICHFIGPAGGGRDRDAPAKLFLTSRRVMLVGGSVQAWPWHRLNGARRIDRDVIIAVAGSADPIQIRMNTFGEALVVAHVINRLAERRAASRATS